MFALMSSSYSSVLWVSLYYLAVFVPSHTMYIMRGKLWYCHKYVDSEWKNKTPVRVETVSCVAFKKMPS